MQFSSQCTVNALDSDVREKVRLQRETRASGANLMKTVAQNVRFFGGLDSAGASDSGMNVTGSPASSYAAGIST